MLKVKTTNADKIQSIVKEFPDEFMESINIQLYCNLCNCAVSCNKSFLVDSHQNMLEHQKVFCQPLKCASNSNIIAQAVEDAVRNFGINRSFFCLLLSDATKYMIAAGTALKSLYPKLFHVTCIVHLLHNCAIKIKSHFEDVDRLILTSCCFFLAP